MSGQWRGGCPPSGARREGSNTYQKGASVIQTLGVRTMMLVRRLAVRLHDERGAAETSTILAWIVVGVLVVFALRTGLQEAGEQVIIWIKEQLDAT